MTRFSIRKRGALLAAAALVFGLAAAAHAQIVDPVNGRITSDNWLVLGPFTNQFGCSNVQEDLLTPHLLPSSIHNMAPEEGDEIEYNPDLASTDGYIGIPGPTGKPAWRAFSDGVDDFDLNFDADAGGDLTDVMSWVVTYLENDSGGDMVVNLCVNSDDGVQVWLDTDLVHSNNACRAGGEATPDACQDVVPVTLTDGPHRIAMGIWENDGGWRGIFGLEQNGVNIIEGGDIIFYGRENPGIEFSTDPLFNRTVTTPSNPNACPPTTGGPISVAITRDFPGGPAIPRIDETVKGPITAAQISFPAGSLAGTASTLVPSQADAFGDGFIKAWLLLGPYAQAVPPGGASPGVDLVRLDYLTDGAESEFDVQPEAGDTIDTDYAPGVAASTGLSVSNSGVNPNETPTWAQWVDADDTINFDEYYGGNFDNLMMYAVTYLVVEAETVVDFCLGSDDAIQILLDDVEVFIGADAPFARPWGAARECQNTVPAVILTAGTHRVLVKVFEGGGGHGFRLGVFESGLLTPPAGVSVCLDPAGPDPCPLDPIGATIAWTNVANADLAPATSRVKYNVNINTGLVTMSGRAGTERIFGAGRGLIIDPPVERGPTTNPAFSHIHNIGAQCAGTGIAGGTNGTLTISGAGGDIWQNGDQFMFAYTNVTGDFSARVNVTDRVYPPASRWGKHGIMARQDCGVRSRYTFMHDNGEDPQDPSRMATRPTHGGSDNFEIPLSSTCDTVSDPLCTHANTLRLDRCGSEFIAFVLDENGTFNGNTEPGAWVEVARHDWGPTAPATVQVGLAVTSHAGCSILSATFEDWELLPTCDAPVGDLTCNENQAGGLNLTWANPPSANTAVNITVEVNDTQVASLPGTATSHTIPAAQIPDGQISKISVINSSDIEAICSFPPQVNTSGFVKHWLMLGPYSHNARVIGTNVTIDELRLDYLRNADGTVNEIDIEPRAGLTVDTAYGGDGVSTGSRSVRLVPTPARPDLNPNGVPTWFVHQDPDDTIDYNTAIGDFTNVMYYNVIYVDVPEDITVDVGVASDDQVQILLDGSEIHANPTARAISATNTVQDVIPAVLLTAGCHQVMVKVFEAAGGHSFRFRFQDSAGALVVPGTFSTAPCGGGGDPQFRRGDTDGSRAVNITDMIRILNFLFAGGPAPTCQDTADTDDSGGLNITDGIYGLNFLFAGGRPIPAPGTTACGADPTPDALPVCTYNC